MSTTRTSCPNPARSRFVPLLSLCLLVAGSCLILAGSGCTSSTPETVVTGPLAAYAGATGADLYRLNPYPIEMGSESPDGDFHGYPIRSRGKLDDPTALLVEISRGIEANEGVAAACFNPRHGLSLKYPNRTVDLVICYECLSMQIHDSASDTTRNELTVESAQRAVDAIFVEAGLPVLPKVE